MANDLYAWFDETRYYVSGFNANIWMSIRKSTKLRTPSERNGYSLSVHIQNHLCVRNEYKIVHSEKIVKNAHPFPLYSVDYPDRRLDAHARIGDKVSLVASCYCHSVCRIRYSRVNAVDEEREGKKKERERAGWWVENQRGTRYRLSHYFKWLQRQRRRVYAHHISPLATQPCSIV